MASPFLVFDREAWGRLRGETPMTLGEADMAELSGITETLSLREVEEVYLPLSRLLNLHRRFLEEGGLISRPYVIAIAGSVAAGKSTTARVLRTLLGRGPNHSRVDLVTTDGFLFPNAVLESRGLMERKGFPESYDRARLVRFMSDLKSGLSPLSAPVYSHLQYDIVPGEEQRVEQPDIVILEGLTVLQTGAEESFVSDFVDFSIYVDAPESELETWFLERFRALRETAFRDPRSFFHALAAMPEDDAIALAKDVWARINLANLRENIAPTRERARLILVKGPQHVVETIMLRRL
jgi:type I pantothenate kinase